MSGSLVEAKVINLIRKKGSLYPQEEGPILFLSLILEEFISEYEGDPRYSSELLFAQRLDAFLLDDNVFYYDA